MSEIPVARLNIAATHLFGAAQMRIPILLRTRDRGDLRRGRVQSGIQANGRVGPHQRKAAQPVTGPAIVAVVFLLKLTGDGLVGSEGGALLDLPVRQVNGDLCVIAACCIQGMRRDQHLPTPQPCSSVRDEVADCPAPVIEVEFIHMPHLSIKAAQLVGL